MIMRKIRTSISIIKKVKNWPRFFLNFPQKKETIIKFRDEVILHTFLPQNILEVWIQEGYTPKGFQIKPNDTVIDIGAHIGSFSVYAARKANNIKVFSYEPDKRNFNRIKENILLNNLENLIKPNLLGVSSKNETKTFYLDYEHPGNQSLFVKTKNPIEIKCITLNKIFDSNNIKQCNFLKMDCEGAEFDILYSSKNILKKVDKIAMEFHNLDKKQNNHTELKRFLENCGFKVIVKGLRKDDFFPLGVGMLYAIKIKT